ncbi:MAG: DUF4214 domain-containing protein [Desulfarculaceae bacterium]|jgi:hypothetical protein
MFNQRVIKRLFWKSSCTAFFAVLTGLLMTLTAAAFVISDEESLVQHLYTEILHREAGSSDLTLYSDRFRQGATVPEMARGLVESGEFQSAYHSDSQYVTMLYRALLGRDPDSDGFQSWMEYLANNSGSQGRLAALESFLAEPELVAVGKDVSSVAWKLVHVFDEVRDMAGLEAALFVIAKQNPDDSRYQLFRSLDGGDTWQQISLKVTDPRNLYALTADQQRLYVSGDGGIYRSDNQGDGFAWEFHWWWDPTVDVDVRDGQGWSAVNMWGSNSGILYRPPDGSWRLCPGLNTGSQVVADSLDPSSTVYVGNAYGYYLSRDGGQTWSGLSREVLFSANLAGGHLVLSQDHFSTDHASTWSQLPTYGWDSMLGYDVNDTGDALIAAGRYQVWRGNTSSMVPIMGDSGTSESGLVARAAGRIFVSRGKGSIYRME